jgi:hypothetical protein
MQAWADKGDASEDQLPQQTAQGVDSATRDVIPAEVATKIGHEEGKAKKDQRDSTVELGQQSSLNQAAGGAKKVCAMWLAWARYS